MGWLSWLFGNWDKNILTPVSTKPSSVLRPTHAQMPSQKAPPAPVTFAGEWAAKVPRRVVAIDVETTGLGITDRIVTFAAVAIDGAEISENNVICVYRHAIFDPGKRSHPRAEELHGYSDWILRHQSPFAEVAIDIHEFLSSFDVLVAHNAEFDLAFLNKEFLSAGLPPLSATVYCTLTHYRERYPGAPANLDAVARRIGRDREGKLHSALEDALVALSAFLWLKDIYFPFELWSQMQKEPTNLLPVPSIPEGPLPRRKRLPKAKIMPK